MSSSSLGIVLDMCDLGVSWLVLLSYGGGGGVPALGQCTCSQLLELFSKGDGMEEGGCQAWPFPYS